MAIAHRDGFTRRLDRHGTAKATSYIGHRASFAVDDFAPMENVAARGGFYATRRSTTPHFSVNARISHTKQCAIPSSRSNS
jgi:hypothetical protein